MLHGPRAKILGELGELNSGKLAQHEPTHTQTILWPLLWCGDIIIYINVELCTQSSSRKYFMCSVLEKLKSSFF